MDSCLQGSSIHESHPSVYERARIGRPGEQRPGAAPHLVASPKGMPTRDATAGSSQTIEVIRVGQAGSCMGVDRGRLAPVLVGQRPVLRGPGTHSFVTN